MADIKLKIGYPIKDGSDFVFHAPCDCSAVDGIVMEHPGGTQRFVFKDAHGHELTGIGNLFSTGSLVKVVLDVVNSAAVIQNADTNGYLESRFKDVETDVTVQTKRIDSILAGEIVGIDDTYVIDNDTMHVEIRSSGAVAELTYQIKDLHLDGGERYECYDIPLLLAPMFEPEITCSMNKLVASLIIDAEGVPVLRFHNEDTQRTVSGATGSGVYSLAHVISPELADIRIGKDGTVYESAGAAVRAQAVLVDSAVSMSSQNPVEAKAIAFELQRVYNAINELETKVDESVAITVDSELDPNSENPVQNKAVADKINELSQSAGEMIGNLGASIQSVRAGLDTKQDTLKDAVNIKTINGQSILGEGNLNIAGGGGGGGGGGGSITVDTALSETSENPVQNKVITAAIGAKQNALVSGENIKTINGQSLVGSGNIAIEGGGSDITVDAELDADSTNPVQNKAIHAAIKAIEDGIPQLVEDYVEQYISDALGGDY